MGRDAERSVPRMGGVVLAAGRSTRMGGSNKLLCEVDGAPMICRVVDAFLEAALERVIVVTGYQSERVAAALGARPASVVVNHSYVQGMASSLRVGAEAVADALDGVVVGLGDMPWVRAEHIDALIDAFVAGGPSSICVPVHEGERGHPVLWPARYLGELGGVDGDVGGKPLLARHAESVRPVEVADPGVLRDVDTPDELLARSP